MNEQQAKMPVDYKALMARQAAEIAKRVGAPSGDTIRVKTDKTFILPGEVEIKDPFPAVVIDFVSANYYYKTAYNPKDITPPDCFALHPEPALMVPSHNAIAQQAANCAECPQNQWGSGGGNRKACNNHRLLALIYGEPVLNDLGDLDIAAMNEKSLWVLRLSPSAIRHFDAHVTRVSREHGTTLAGVISTIGFSGASEYPMVVLGPPRPNPHFAYYMSRYEEARARLMTEPQITVVEAPQLPTPKGSTRIKR